MNPLEREYIAQCKRLIEVKLHFDRDNGTLRQRNLEYLADIIEEKSGIKLSLSTLKRLWKQDYDQTPHPSTLEALVSVLGYKSWQEFKLKEATGVSSNEPVQQEKNKQLRSRWVLFPVLAALAIVCWLIAFRSGKPVNAKPLIKGPVVFTGNKTVTQGVPNTVIFNYDVGNVEADSFFFQQSWNNQEKVRLDTKGHYYSNIYYYPGFHRAKLIANDSIIKKFRVHITTDGWLPLVRSSFLDNQPEHLNKNRFVTKGALHVTQNDLVASNITVAKDFLLSYFNIREFENTYSDNFSIDTRIMCDSLSTVACPGFELVITCEEHIFLVRIMGKGCERNSAVKMGEAYRDGIKNDLSAFGRDLYQWQHLQIQVVNKQAVIYLDEQPVYRIAFKKDFGKIVGLVYNFTGTGAIDYVRLKNNDNKVVYEDEFDSEDKK